MDIKLKKELIYTVIILVILLSIIGFAQNECSVIINEIGNGGTKKGLYNGGDFIELLVIKDEGVKLAGWYLTDLSSTGGTPKETEGYIKFSDAEGSIFNQVIPKGTYILICVGDSRQNYVSSLQTESISISEGKVVVFTEESSKHIQKIEGTISLTGKDNIALLSSWDKKSAVDIVTWEGSTSWLGAETTQLSVEKLENGEIVYFIPTNDNFNFNTSSDFWISTKNVQDSTPGNVNKDVVDSILK
jgi:hypothetical protein